MTSLYVVLEWVARSPMIARKVFADRSIHEHSHGIPGLLADFVQLADPITVDPRVVQSLVIVSPDTFWRHIAL